MLRDYEDEIEEQCLKLISSCYRDNGPRDKLSNLKVVVAEIGSSIVGLGALEKNGLHETIVVEYICVDPKYRGQGVGEHLHDFLLKTYPLQENELLDISCYSNQQNEKSFIAKLGFKRYLECYLNLYRSSEVKKIDAKYKISSLSEFYQVESSKSLVKDFHIKRYNQEHNDHLPVSDDKEIWDDYFSDGDLFLGVVLHDNERIYATSFAYLDFEVEIGETNSKIICFNGYAVGNDIFEEASNLISLYSYQCELIKDRDVLIYTEVDSTEKNSHYLQEWLPECQNVYERYQLGK
jgi:ribosomal protein S18 acetylase RimI-like enzyme